jgi:hypothetical protein
MSYIKSDDVVLDIANDPAPERGFEKDSFAQAKLLEIFFERSHPVVLYN